MITVVAEMVLSGIFVKKQDFVVRVCNLTYRYLLPYISFYENLNSKEFWMSLEEYDNYSMFLTNITNITTMIDSGMMVYNKDYIVSEENEDIVYLSSKGVHKCSKELTKNYLDELKYINSEYKYYLDELLYLNINIQSD